MVCGAHVARKQNVHLPARAVGREGLRGTNEQGRTGHLREGGREHCGQHGGEAALAGEPLRAGDGAGIKPPERSRHAPDVEDTGASQAERERLRRRRDQGVASSFLWGGRRTRGHRSGPAQSRGSAC